MVDGVDISEYFNIYPKFFMYSITIDFDTPEMVFEMSIKYDESWGNTDYCTLTAVDINELYEPRGFEVSGCSAEGEFWRLD